MSRALVGQVEIVAGDPGHGLGGYAVEAAHAVVLVHHVVALAQIAEAGQLQPRQGTPLGDRLVTAREDESVGEQGQLEVGDHEVTAEGPGQERDPRAVAHVLGAGQRAA